MTTLNEGVYAGDIVKYEADNRYSREAGVVGSAADLEIGQVVGQAVTGGFTVSDAVKASGTGDGTITQSGTAADRYGDDVMAGIYKLTCKTGGATGTFEVVAPNGAVIGTATVGTAFASSHLNFTINDGGVDWDVGAVITITVNATAEGKYYKYDPAGTDGRQIAAGILLQEAAAASADVDAVVLVRHAIVESSRLVWPAGFTDAQKSTGLAQLEARGIIAKTGV